MWVDHLIFTAELVLTSLSPVGRLLTWKEACLQFIATTLNLPPLSNCKR